MLYYGDELAIEDVPVPSERVRDQPRLHDRRPPRDPARTPMRWTAERGRGFTHAAMAERTWLPLGSGTDVAEQLADAGSTLHLTRALITLRRRRADELIRAVRSCSTGPRVDSPTGADAPRWSQSTRWPAL